MRYLTISEILELHDRLLASSGGAAGIRDLGALESAVSQIQMLDVERVRDVPANAPR